MGIDSLQEIFDTITQSGDSLRREVAQKYAPQKDLEGLVSEVNGLKTQLADSGDLGSLIEEC